ncbi:MAG TPA: hypothetical protein VMG12_20135, partial [Polyangiaceae bacterium]|nr:hypothetical protein [Polyangiaceae bacterium]
ISGARCEAMSIGFEFESVQGNACECDTADGGQLTIGPVGVGCSLRGRDGQCIFGDDDYAACDRMDPNACTAICADAAARIEADSSRAIATELVLAECRESNCRSVVSLDGRCYANRDYAFGGWEERGQDCSLGAEAILTASDAAHAPPVLTPLPEDQSAYPPGSDALLLLEVTRDWYGTTLGYQGFGVTAQFFETVEGASSASVDVIDPLDGIDDCGVSRRGSSGTEPLLEFLDVERAVLRDGAAERELEEFAPPGTGFFSYGIDLESAGVAPRYGEGYGFSASGGGFGASIDLDGIVLPDALSVPTFETQSRFERGPIELTWTGRSSAPLALSLSVSTVPGQSPSSPQVTCRLADDGAFTVPGDVLEALPDGDVLVRLARTKRGVQRSGGKSIRTWASVNVNHRFALGAACDGTASMAACQASAELIDAAYEACGVEPVPRATLCPDYIGESCIACPEYFECVGRSTTCTDQGLYNDSFGCSCP